MKHSAFGPSSLDRRERCPGSWRLEKDLPSFETEHAAEGTRLHELIAKAISAFMVGKEPTLDEEPVRLAFAKFIEVVLSAGNTNLKRRIANKENIDIYVERKLSFKYLGEEVFYGTSDVVIVLNDRVVIIDWKFGHRQVEDAANNNQGAAYAIAAMQEFKREVVEVHFFNPVIFQHTHHEFRDRQGMTRFILGIISACKAENAPIIASESACRYCKAAHYGTCPAHRQCAEAMTVSASKIVPLPALSVLPEDQLRDIFDKCKIVEKLQERVVAEIGRRAEANGECCGMIWKESSGGRECKDINGMFAAVKDVIPTDEFLDCCTLSVAKIEKAFAKTLKDAGKCKTEKEGKAEFNAKAGMLIADKAKKRSLVQK